MTFYVTQSLVKCRLYFNSWRSFSSVMYSDIWPQKGLVFLYDKHRNKLCFDKIPANFPMLFLFIKFYIPTQKLSNHLERNKPISKFPYCYREIFVSGTVVIYSTNVNSPTYLQIGEKIAYIGIALVEII